MNTLIFVSAQETVRVAELLHELACMLQWQWTLRHKGWRDQDPDIELAAKYQGMRVTNFIRQLRRREPWLSWKVVEGTEAMVQCTALGILCVPPPVKPWYTRSVPAVPAVAPVGWCPALPPRPDPSEAGRPWGGRFFD